VITRYGRKFFLCVMTLSVGAVLLATGLLVGGEFVALVVATVGAYMASNVAQDWAPKDK
jgi:hypothetical protein